jgi:hypothetical protein
VNGTTLGSPGNRQIFYADKLSIPIKIHDKIAIAKKAVPTHRVSNESTFLM